MLVDAQTDILSYVKELLYTDSDLAVTPIIDNPKVRRSEGPSQPKWFTEQRQKHT